MKTLKIHSELQTLLPALSDAEYKGLEADILEHGCLSPLVTWDDYVVDGHNRYAICQNHELPFETIELKFDSLDDAKFWAWSHQEHRRNLTPFQRTEIALRFKPMFAAKAKEKEFLRKSTRQTSAESPLKPVSTKDELAQIAGVSHDTIRKAEFLCNHADDETKDKLRNGETTINKEYKRFRVAEEGETPDFDPEPLQPASPNPIEPYQGSVTLEHILLRDTDSLVSCLFSIFDATYRERLILDVLKKAQTDDGPQVVESIVRQIHREFPIS